MIVSVYYCISRMTFPLRLLELLLSVFLLSNFVLLFSNLRIVSYVYFFYLLLSIYLCVSSFLCVCLSIYVLLCVCLSCVCFNIFHLFFRLLCSFPNFHFFITSLSYFPPLSPLPILSFPSSTSYHLLSTVLDPLPNLKYHFQGNSSMILLYNTLKHLTQSSLPVFYGGVRYPTLALTVTCKKQTITYFV